MRGSIMLIAASVCVFAAVLCVRDCGAAAVEAETAASAPAETTTARMEPSVAADPAAAYYAAAWELADPDTQALLRQFGLEGEDPSAIYSLRPQGVIDALRRLFAARLPAVRQGFVTGACLLLTLSFFLSFFPSGPYREFAEIVGSAVLLFALTAFTARAAEGCAAAITLTADFIKGLIPVYAGVIAFAGNPGLALQYQTLVLAYAEGIGALFAAVVPAAASVGTAVSAAAALQPLGKPSALPALLQKGVRFLMGAAASVFSAVLSVRSVLAGAGDTVAQKGLRFLVGGAVPVVGGAIGEALGSITAGLSLAKSGVGLLAILTVAALNLPALCGLCAWALCLRLLEALAALFANDRICAFLKGCSGICGTMGAALCFNACVYIIAQAIVLQAKGGG